MDTLNPRNPLVLVVKQMHPEFTDAQALAAALGAYRQFIRGIWELSELALRALQHLGRRNDQARVRGAVSRFMTAYAASGLASPLKGFLGAHPPLRDRIEAMILNDDLNPVEVRRLLRDCISIKSGGPAAE